MKLSQMEKQYLMPLYSRFNVVIIRGRGCHVYDNKRAYLDFMGGIATCAVGHANPRVKRAALAAANGIINASCLVYTEPQITLAKKLHRYFFGKSFFCNSGTEANEAAFKLARKYTGRKEFIAFRNGFHGRTCGSLSATWDMKYKKYFQPLVPGFKHIPYDNIGALKAINKNIAAVIMEPIQGEGGIIIPRKGFISAAAAACAKYGALLIMDEVQTGVGRTGKFFAHEWENVQPDIITMGKGLANGIPIGVMMARPFVADAFQQGDHGSTFGGNNLSCAAASAVLEFMEENNLMDNAAAQGRYFLNALSALKSEKNKSVRGRGLLMAMETNGDGKAIAKKLIKNGLLCLGSNKNFIRFLPPLTVTRAQMNQALNIIKQTLCHR